MKIPIVTILAAIILTPAWGDNSLADIWDTSDCGGLFSFLSLPSPPRRPFPKPVFKPQEAIPNYLRLVGWRSRFRDEPAYDVPVEFAGDSLLTLNTLENDLRTNEDFGRRVDAFFQRKNLIVERAATQGRVDHREVFGAVIDYLHVVDRKKPKLVDLQSPSRLSQDFDQWSDRRDFFFFPIVSQMRAREFNQLSPYGIFPSRINSRSQLESGNKMSPKTFFLWDLTHSLGAPTRYSIHPYQDFDLKQLPTRLRLYSQFEEFVRSIGDPEIEEGLHQIYFILNHYINPKLYPLETMRVQYQFVRTSEPVKKWLYENVSREMGRPIRRSKVDAAIESFQEFLDGPGE